MVARSSSKTSLKSLLFIVGPTAVGKTRLSFVLAQKLSASLLNCDSIQMYKGLDIGSAKPDFLHKKTAPASYLFDEFKPPAVCTAGVFRKKALSILKKQLPVRPVVAVGGSGFYIQALEKGMFPVKSVPPEVEGFVRKIKDKHGTKHLYHLLKVWDKQYADTIAEQDSYRIFRALCIILSEKKPLSLIQTSFQKNKKALPYSVLKIGLCLSKEQLLDRVSLRVQSMLQAGLVEETKLLLQQGLADWPLMKSVGYKECVLFLNNKITHEDLQAKIIQRTMRLAKKQMVWFKRDTSISWFVPDKHTDQDIYQFVSQRLKKADATKNNQ